MPGITIDSIVAIRDKKPYVRLMLDGKVIGQLSAAETRKIAADLLQAISRAEADAMIAKFFSTNEFPEGALMALMVEFRKFRQGLDQEPVESTMTDPDTGKPV